MKHIGETFARELAAAGISGEGIAWGADGQISFSPSISEQTRSAVMVVLEKHNPSAKDPDIETEKAEAELIQIDIRSIRAIREYIAAQHNASEVVRTREAEAIAARAKIKQF